MRTARTIADALRIVRTDRGGDGPPRPRPRRGRGLGERRSARQHLDQRRALHRAEQAGAAPRQPQFLVRRAEVAIRQRAPQRGRDAHQAPRPPRVPRRRCVDAGDGQAHAAAHRHPAASAHDAPHVERAGDAEVRRHGVVAQHAFQDDRIVAGQRRQLRGERPPGPRGRPGRARRTRRAGTPRRRSSGPSGAIRPTRRSPRHRRTRRGPRPGRVLRPERTPAAATESAGRTPSEHRDGLRGRDARRSRRRRGHADPDAQERDRASAGAFSRTAVRASQILRRQATRAGRVRDRHFIDASTRLALAVARQAGLARRIRPRMQAEASAARPASRPMSFTGADGRPSRCEPRTMVRCSSETVPARRVAQRIAAMFLVDGDDVAHEADRALPSRRTVDLTRAEDDVADTPRARTSTWFRSSSCWGGHRRRARRSDRRAPAYGVGTVAAAGACQPARPASAAQ